MFFNGKKTKEIVINLVQAVQQRDGLMRWLDLFRGRATGRTESGQQQQQSDTRSRKGANTKASRSKDTASDSERAKTKSRITPPPTQPSGSIESNEMPIANEEDSDYEADYTSEEGESLTIVKRKPRKI